MYGPQPGWRSASPAGRLLGTEVQLANGRQRLANKKAIKNNRKVLGVQVGPRSEAAPASTAVPSVLPLTGQSESEGRVILRRLALGDRPALDVVVEGERGDEDVQAHEWGLASRSGQFWLVSGAEGEIDWSQLPGYRPIAHTHPYRLLRNEAILSGLLVTTIADALNGWAQASSSDPASARILDAMPGALWYLFPSNADLVSGYLGDAGLQTVYTPYRIGPDGRLSRTEGPALQVDYGPVGAVLSADWTETAKNSPVKDAGHIERMCLRSFVAPVSFVTEDNITRSQGYLRCQASAASAADSYSGSAAWYFATMPPSPTPPRPRAAVLQAIRDFLGTG